MPHATGQHDPADDENDDIAISRILNPGDPTDLEHLPFLNRDLVPGDKADDAVDYEDFGDDDLPNDDDAADTQELPVAQLSQPDAALSLDAFMRDGDLPALTNDDGVEDDGMDDLFGDIPSSPVYANGDTGLHNANDIFGDDSGQVQVRPGPRPTSSLQEQRDTRGQSSILDIPQSKDHQIQMKLFSMSTNTALRSGQESPPAPPENQEELLTSLWPKFKRDAIPKFIDLLPPRKARYVGKTIPKPPNPVIPTKISLELAPDQEKSFRIWPVSNKRSREDIEQRGIVVVEQDVINETTDNEHMDLESDFEKEPVGGISWEDLQIVCEDWDVDNLVDSLESNDAKYRSSRLRRSGAFGDIDQEGDYETDCPATKRRNIDTKIIRTPQFTFPSLYDPERATSKIARTVTLDLNDPQLLIDQVQCSAPSRSVFGRSDLKRAGRGAFTKGLSQRYNISNDEAYDLLKENHQSKVRSMLGNVPVEHSLPAVRLQWPFYKTKLDKQDARSFHRPSLTVGRNEYVLFGRPRFLKRKHIKGKDTQTLFHESNDLSLGDNSNVLLLEYSEEYPTMMSNVGMGNRVINYYRRKTMEDTSRPKLDIGETAVLLPQDKSPFSIFGHVDPGQTIPALYNGMYRAPIFKQAAKDTDFLVVRHTTGMDGSTWFLRNIENLYAVGQEFPSIDVPGPHSRKVTTASKNRLKMLSYRLIRKNKTHRISVQKVTSHFADTTDMQNRQKMKEFMQFNKEHKEWQMRSGETIPDEGAVRSMVKPEDVCLLESMQVGQQHLQDAGFNKEDDESGDDDAKEGQSVEQLLAPWYTSRNFLHATQGKAMLALHGEGDPTGRGEAFSFIKTSMKGGFKAAEASATEKMRAKQMKDSNGHAYNVQEQQKSYEQSIRRIWESQKQSLTSGYEQNDIDIDEDPIEEASKNALGPDTPRSEAQTTATIRRRDDENASQYTQHSTASQAGRVLKITRNVRDENGALVSKTDVTRDAKVIRQYMKRKQQMEEETLGVDELSKPTGDPAKDKRHQILLKKELERLEKNKERRLAREKGKGVHFDGTAEDVDSPSSPATGTTKAAGTQRKCANCGQIGHIKTNKKCAPLSKSALNPFTFPSSLFIITEHLSTCTMVS